MTEAEKKKRKFRSTNTWKNFRKYMRSKFKVDALTGKPLRAGWQLHHLDLDENNYNVLNEKMFCCVNRNSHKIIHEIYRYDTENYINNLHTILNQMKEINKK